MDESADNEDFIFVDRIDCLDDTLRTPDSESDDGFIIMDYPTDSNPSEDEDVECVADREKTNLNAAVPEIVKEDVVEEKMEQEEEMVASLETNVCQQLVVPRSSIAGTVQPEQSTNDTVHRTPLSIGIGIVSIMVLMSYPLIQQYFDDDGLMVNDQFHGLSEAEIAVVGIHKEKVKGEYTQSQAEEICALKTRKFKSNEMDLNEATDDGAERKFKTRFGTYKKPPKDVKYFRKQSKFKNKMSDDFDVPKKKVDKKSKRVDDKQYHKLAKEIKKFFKRHIKMNFNNEDADWYIKYSPTKHTFELVDITKLSEEDSYVLRNGNRTINGQWYFSLYGQSRENLRRKGDMAEWYFKRNQFRDGKRNKAKWYFDYMSARRESKFLY